MISMSRGKTEFSPHPPSNLPGGVFRVYFLPVFLIRYLWLINLIKCTFGTLIARHPFAASGNICPGLYLLLDKWFLVPSQKIKFG